MTKSEKTVNTGAPTIFNRVGSNFKFYRKEFTNNTQMFSSAFYCITLTGNKYNRPLYGLLLKHKMPYFKTA
jgi:hypothetical protein